MPCSLKKFIFPPTNAQPSNSNRELFKDTEYDPNAETTKRSSRSNPNVFLDSQRYLNAVKMPSNFRNIHASFPVFSERRKSAADEYQNTPPQVVETLYSEQAGLLNAKCSERRRRKSSIYEESRVQTSSKLIESLRNQLRKL
uniref:Uncharacterized protein n=1 Tax=Syphacia muris TaxID=451379 RepID=A0A0N5AAA5_9BILA